MDKILLSEIGKEYSVNLTAIELSMQNWIPKTLVLCIGLFFVLMGLKYTSEAHEKAKEQSKQDPRTRYSLKYKGLAKFVRKSPWWIGRILFIFLGSILVILAILGYLGIL
jgi:putative Mn2+ efflux pump MntP